MKTIITRNGYIKDLICSIDKICTFKTFNERKLSLTDHGEKSFEWIKLHFGWHDIEIVYEENGMTTIIAKEKEYGHIS